MRSSPDRAVRVSALTVDTLMCSWVRHLRQVRHSLSASLHLGVQMGTGELNVGRNLAVD